MSAQLDTAQPKISTRLAPALSALTLTRLVINGSRRFPYVILTPMAAALGVPRATLETALSLQWLVGAFSPIIGSLIERLGRKRIMLLGVAMLAASSAVAALGGSFAFVVLAIVVGGMGKMIFDPAMQAYIGDRVPYARRGMAIGVTELSWSGSLVVFGPLAAYLISQVSLSAIYAAIAIGSVASFALLVMVLPSDSPNTALNAVQDASDRAVRSSTFRLLWTSHPALAMLAASFLISIASEILNISYESWLRGVFALTTAALGLLSWAISAAEVVGEGFVITLADRIGKRRLTIFTLAATGVIYFALPFTAGNLPAAVIGLFLMFLTFEISVVVLIPLTTEVLPTARGIMLSSSVAAVAVGRAVGTLTGGWLFRTGGFAVNGTLAALFNLLAAVLIWRLVRAEALD